MTASLTENSLKDYSESLLTMVITYLAILLLYQENNQIFMLVSNFLLSLFLAVTAVESGSKALEFLGLMRSSDPPSAIQMEVNLVITDYCMPEMTGYDLLKKIKVTSLAHVI